MVPSSLLLREHSRTNSLDRFAVMGKPGYCAVMWFIGLYNHHDWGGLVFARCLYRLLVPRVGWLSLLASYLTSLCRLT